MFRSAGIESVAMGRATCRAMEKRGKRFAAFDAYILYPLQGLRSIATQALRIIFRAPQRRIAAEGTINQRGGLGLYAFRG